MMTTTTTGRRIYPNEKGEIILQSGDYVFDLRGGYWVAKTPNGLLAGLKAHKVVENEDKTITVSPSILVKGYTFENSQFGDREITWHGFLERGIWREV